MSRMLLPLELDIVGIQTDDRYRTVSEPGSSRSCCSARGVRGRRGSLRASPGERAHALQAWIELGLRYRISAAASGYTIRWK